MNIIKVITFPFWVIPMAVWRICDDKNQAIYSINPGWHKVNEKYHYYDGFHLDGKRLTPKQMYEYESKLIKEL